MGKQSELESEIDELERSFLVATDRLGRVLRIFGLSTTAAESLGVFFKGQVALLRSVVRPITVPTPSDKAVITDKAPKVKTSLLKRFASDSPEDHARAFDELKKRAGK